MRPDDKPTVATFEIKLDGDEDIRFKAAVEPIAEPEPVPPAPPTQAEESAVYPAAFASLAEEFAKPQFMTTTSGIGLHTLQFSFHGEGARERRDALHDAIRTAAKAVNS